MNIVLTRQRLTDGYSDDVITALADNTAQPMPKIVVLLAYGTPPAVEARQVKIGADCVLRDPVRTEVLLEYLVKYRSAPDGTSSATTRAPEQRVLRFAGGEVFPVDRQWRRGQRVTRLTPREIDLIEALVQSEGRAISYHNLFSEVLGRRFRGDTGNLRVLLGILDDSAKRIGIPLRRWVEVIRKLGYRYRRPAASTRPPSPSNRRTPRSRA